MMIVAHFDLELVQMDVKKTFRHGELDEEIFIDQLEGFVSENPHKACKLKHSINGLKQSSRR